MIWIPIGIVLGIIFILIMILAGTYNGLVNLRNLVRNAWSQIDVQLKRRFDLIPNLVETAKGYMKHERETLEAVTQARAGVAKATGAGAGERGRAEGMLEQALGRLFAVAEAYPDLKANQNFLSLQEELTSTENRISFARQAYNDSVLQYNNKTEMFPSSIVAGMFNFQRSEFFEVTEAEQREAPKVSFS